MNLRFRVAFFFFFCFQLKVPRSETLNDTVPGTQSNTIRHLFLGSTPLEKDLLFKNVFQPFKKEFLQLGVISQTIRGVDLCVALWVPMVSHAGHINTGEQASVTHSWVCSSPKAPARLMPMQTTLPIPLLNHTGFLQEPGAKIQFWKWRFWVPSIHMMGTECWEEYSQGGLALFFLSRSTPSEQTIKRFTVSNGVPKYPKGKT